MQQSTYLILNSGSSSLKFSLINTAIEQAAKQATGQLIISGLAECLNSDAASLSYQIHLSDQVIKKKVDIAQGDHQSALSAILNIIERQADDTGFNVQIAAVGHRVVHGGEHFKQACLIDQAVLTEIEKCNALAPLHNPANLLGINQITQLMPNCPQVAVFDTAFHQTMPPHAFLYALPYAYYQDLGVRKYGFHGTSHQYISEQAIYRLKLSTEKNGIISAHLGNGCSVCAIKNSQSIDTSMGLTPLEGIVMGTRSGDIDPGLHAYLSDKLDLSIHQITDILNKKSGLLGLSGQTNDMRKLCQLMQAGDKQAALAIEVFCYRLAKQIAALSVNLDKLDALVFTGGIGENAAFIRQKTIEHLSIFNWVISDRLNQANGDHIGRIDKNAVDQARILVIPTNEELMIAKQTKVVLDAVADLTITSQSAKQVN